MPSLTTTGEVLVLLAPRDTHARHTWAHWNTHTTPVVDRATRNHVTEIAYRLTPDEISDYAEDPFLTETALHPVLGPAHQAPPPPPTYHSGLSLTWALHHHLETSGDLFTWRQFVGATGGTDPLLATLRPALGTPGYRHHFHGVYRQFLRRLHLVAVLRQAGHDIELHPLAADLYRADAFTSTPGGTGVTVTLTGTPGTPARADITTAAEHLADNPRPWRHLRMRPTAANDGSILLPNPADILAFWDTLLDD